MSPEELFSAAPASSTTFDPDCLKGFDETVRRYFLHALAPGSLLPNAILLRMRGEIRLKSWCPFEATQAITRSRGMVWAAQTRVSGIAISGFDRILDGEAQMRWNLLGLFPFLRASGPDVTRSASGRWVAEMVWMPGALLDPSVAWHAKGPDEAVFAAERCGYETQVALSLNREGAVRSVRFQRWGNPGGTYRMAEFGGPVHCEAEFDGTTVPGEVEMGWDGDAFFRAKIVTLVAR